MDPSSNPTIGFPYAAVCEVNERCIALLVNAARLDAPPPFSMVEPLRGLLRATTPEIRRRAACGGLLLVDMGFAHAQWWRSVRHQPERVSRSDWGTGSFPRRAAVPLARATLVLAWHALQADHDTACALLGIHGEVAEAIGSMSLGDIDRTADRHFRRIRPRWSDRPAIWRTLLESSALDRPTAGRDFVLQGLTLLAADALGVGARGS